MKHVKTAAALFLAAGFCGLAQADADAIRRSLGESLPGTTIREVRPAPIPGLFEVVLNGFDVLYTDATGKLAIKGNLFRVADRSSLTAQRVEELQRVDFAKLPLDRAIVTVRGNGTRKLAVFSDPDCPYCQRLEKELREIDNVTIYTYLLPLPSLHPDAPRKAKLVWCSKDRAKAWDDLMLRQVEPAGTGDCATPIDEIAALADKFYINGTPGIVFASGKLVPGVLPWKQIDQMLDKQGTL